MAKIQTFELDRWSEPDENHRVKHIGMADAKETFDKLKTHLEAHGLLPDEYFSFSGKYEGLTGLSRRRWQTVFSIIRHRQDTGRNGGRLFPNVPHRCRVFPNAEWTRLFL